MDNDSASSSPRTPTRTPTRTHFPSPPSLGSPMSLHRLGFASSLSSLRRGPFSSPQPRQSSPGQTADGGGDDDAASNNELGQEVEDDDDDLTQDSRDVLVDRLNDLAQRLSRGGSVQDDGISALHAKVDEMEKVLAHSSPKPVRSRPHSFIVDSKRDDHDIFWGPSTSPSWLFRKQFSDMSESALLELGVEPRSASVPQAGSEGQPAGSELGAGVDTGLRPVFKTKLSSDVVDKIVAEAEQLCQELSTVVKNLQERREESDHIRGLLVERAEHSAGRIMDLEARVDDLEDEVQGNESELSYLRLQLKSIELQCLEYMPEEVDPDLVQSIKNWRSDWRALRDKWVARRQNSTLSVSSLPSVHTPGH